MSEVGGSSNRLQSLELMLVLSRMSRILSLQNVLIEARSRPDRALIEARSRPVSPGIQDSAGNWQEFEFSSLVYTLDLASNVETYQVNKASDRTLVAPGTIIPAISLFTTRADNSSSSTKSFWKAPFAGVRILLLLYLWFKRASTDDYYKHINSSSYRQQHILMYLQFTSSLGD